MYVCMYNIYIYISATSIGVKMGLYRDNARTSVYEYYPKDEKSNGKETVENPASYILNPKP